MYKVVQIMEEILRLFPDDIKRIIDKQVGDWGQLQEIRFRLYKPVELIFNNQTTLLESVIPTKEDGIYLLNQLSQFSLYRMEDELREGYITIEGGHRVGLAGKVNTLKGTVKAIQYITFFNIRIAKQMLGVSRSVLPHVYDQKNGTYFNTLIIGAPQTGKTTLIRDLARSIATKSNTFPDKKVGIIDERSEIAASLNGIPQHNVGVRSDVMDACPKAEGMMMMIRSMSPEIIIVDEIGSSQDVHALLEAIHAGVTIFCTIHGQSITDLKRRPSLRPLFDQQVFKRYVLLSQKGAPVIQHVLDNEEKIMRRALS